MEVPPVPENDAFRFRVRLKTRWSDEDNHGVLNNAVYLTLLEESRYAYFGGLGLLSDNHFPFVLAQCNIRFMRPGRGGREMEVAVATTHLGTRSFKQSYRMWDPEIGAVLAEAEAVLVLWDDEAKTSVPMSAAFRNAVSGFEARSGV